MQFILLIAMGLLMYVVLILPQQRRTREHQALLSALEAGDEVMTNAGVYGFIAAVDGDVVWVEVAEGVELKMSKASVASKVAAPEEQDGDD